MRKGRVAAMLSVFVAALCAFWYTSNVPTKAQGMGQTALSVTNGSNAAVQVYLTLGAFPGFYGTNPGYVQNVQQVTFNPPVTWSGSGLQGSFMLQRGQKVTYNPPPGTAISGNISFGTPPLSCPPTNYPNGINLAEFTLDNNTPAYVHPPQAPSPQEAIDISCVNGVNCRMQFNLSGGGNWGTAGQTSVTTFSNLPLGTKPNSPNLNKVGVFPPGCDNCTSSDNPGCNNVWLNWGNANTKAVCNVQRPATSSGGEVAVVFKQFY